MPDTYRVTLVPSEESFEVGEGETVLDAALRQGVSLDFGCRQGNCSSCKYFMPEGEVDFGKASPYALSEAEREDGYALMCCATPLEDLEIEDHVGSDPRELPVLSPDSRQGVVRDVSRITPSLFSLRIGLDRPLDFYPGQFVELAVPGEEDLWRAYSIASWDPAADELAFLIKEIPGGAFSGQLADLAEGVQIDLRGPYGRGYLREGEGPVLLAATGSGLAPLQSILGAAAAAGSTREFKLYFGGRTRPDLEVLAATEALCDSLPGLEVHASLSQPTGECGWEGHVGRITQAIQQEVADASPFDAHLCGAPEMCNDLGRLLDAKGIGEGRVFFDRFHPASSG